MISIIIPTLNEEKVLEQTIKSLRKLNICRYEIIVSDGKSIDNTLPIAQKYADKIISYTGEARQTIAMGRNLGASIAEGDYLVFIDADVIIPNINNFFSKAINLFEKKRLVGLTVYIKVFPEMSTFSDRLIFGAINNSHYFLNNFLNVGSAIGEFQMIEVGTFKKLNGYNEKIVVGEDRDMFSRLSKIGQVYIESSLNVLHTSRRAHNVGWSSLITFWMKNTLYLKFYKHSSVSEWKPIR